MTARIATANRILALLPPKGFERLRAQLEPVVLRFGQVLMVGNEGRAGMPFVLGIGVSGVRALVQGGGNAWRIASGPFRVEFDRNRPLQRARLARWLLMNRDRVGSDEFGMTQGFLAHMLGLRREGVTEAASALKQRRLITVREVYRRAQTQPAAFLRPSPARARV